MSEEHKEQIKNFFSKYKTVKYKKGEILLKPGEKVDFVGYSKSGFVRVYILNENGQEITLLFFRPMFYFTLMFALTNMENRFYFETITPSEIHKVPIEDAYKFFKENEDISRKIIGIVFKGLMDQIEQMGLFLAGSAYRKVALSAGILGSRLQKKDGDYAQIDFKITHKLIASMTGLTRETVTLQMIKLEKEGLLDNRNRKVIVLDEEGLLKAARQEVVD